ncbi:D-xylulose reductase A [Colletotrichum siamense]|nr:D-xylulose reductase A [Colletotrichum siamense]
MTETSLPTSNKAVVWVGPKKLEIQERPVRPPGDDEVLVEIVATGICGSDCHNWESDKVSCQLVLGHESSGIIIQTGKGVKDRCEFCVKGNPNICANLKYCGLDPTDGTLCQYFTCIPSMTVPIPDTVSWEEAGAIQPLAIAVQLARRASLNAHQTMAIFGCGPLGLLVLAIAKAYGVKKVIMFDIESSRTQFAETYGATVGIVPPKNEDPSVDSLSFYQQYAKDLNYQYDLGNGFDVTVEASGAEACIQMAVAMLKSGGTCIQAGLGKPLTPVPLFLVTAKELDIKGTVRYTPGCFADAISLLERNLVNLTPLITSTYPLTEAYKAFEAQHSRKDIKIIIWNQK